MKLARVAVLGIALVAGGIAALLAGRSKTPEPQPVVVQQAPSGLEATEVLVAVKDIPTGAVLKSEDLAWKPFPKDGAASFVRREAEPNALEGFVGAIARQPFLPGEPIRAQKLIKADGSGFLSAILPAGMRAISTEISAETGAGGFILPNDRVDVLLTQRGAPGPGGREEFTSSTVLTNARVLAIDQTVEEKDGQKVVIGRTATLELSPRQAETLAVSRQMGTISLALRSLADANTGRTEEVVERPAGNLTVVRFGIATQSPQR